MIGIASTIFDLNGYIVLHNYKRQQGHRSGERRLSSTATMGEEEGQIEDNGSKQFGRRLNITLIKPTKGQADRLQYLNETYSDLRISTEEGVFLGVIANFREAPGKFIFSIIIKQRLTTFTG